MLDRPILVVAIIAGAGMFASSAAWAKGPSFDCAAAGTSVEYAICEDVSLSVLDREMVRLYERAQNAIGAEARSFLLAEQKAWVAARDTCEDWGDGVTGCVRAAYGNRILTLRHAYPANRVQDDGAITSGLFALRCDSGRGGFVGVYVNSPDPIYVLRWDASVGVLSRWATDPFPEFAGIDTGAISAGDTITLIEADDGLRLTIGDAPEDRCSLVWED